LPTLLTYSTRIIACATPFGKQQRNPGCVSSRRGAVHEAVMGSVPRQGFVAGCAAFGLAGRAKAAAAAEERVNNVLVESDRWLLPGWEALTDPDDAGQAKTLDLVGRTATLPATRNIGLLLVSIPFKARYCDVHRVPVRPPH
jgi:hypothetical protein